MECIENGLIESCHDISDGGVAICLAELCFVNNIGCNITIPGNFSNEVLLFSETGGFIFESDRKNRNRILNLFSSSEVSVTRVGITTRETLLNLNSKISAPIDKAHFLWKEGLRSKL